MTTTPHTLDQQVEARIDLLNRWTQAIRHDLGNVIYPSNKVMLAAAAEGPAGETLAQRVGDLLDMLAESRQILSLVRPIDDSDRAGAVVPAEWWSQAKPLLRALLRPGSKIIGPEPQDRALPVTPRGLTMLVMPVLIAIDLQATGPEAPVVTIGHPKDARALTISVDSGTLGPSVLPSLLDGLAKRLGADVCADPSDAASVRFVWR
jgi:hypothetical protein